MVDPRRQDDALGCGRALAVSRSLYVIGAPGTGKSSLMRRVVAGLGLSWGPEEHVWRELWVNPLLSPVGVQKGVSLGRERGTFSGTDALSMSAQPRVLEWLLHATELPEYVVGEGMRLSSPRFLIELDSLAPLTLVYLSDDDQVTDERRARREGGDNLTPTFVKQARTRAANAAQTMDALGYPVLSFHGHTLDTITEKVLEELSGG